MADDDPYEPVTVKLYEDDYDYIQDNWDSVSGTSRRLISGIIDAEKEFDLREDHHAMQLAILRAYKNAIAKQIQTLEAQKDKLQGEINELEEEGSEGEVLFEIDFKMNSKHL